MSDSRIKITIKVEDKASRKLRKLIRGTFWYRLKMFYRRWRCNHFDHPFRLVKELPSKLDPLAPIMDEYWCGYCQRKFDMPVLHQNCRCQVLPIVRNDK